MMWGIDDLKSPTTKHKVQLDTQVERLISAEGRRLGNLLIEMIRLYDDEENRRKSIDSKSGAIVAVNGVILGILRFPRSESLESDLVTSSLVLFIISTIICLVNLYPQKYFKATTPNEIPELTRLSSNEYNKKIFKKYLSATFFNMELNDVRYRRYLLAVYSTILGIILIGLLTLVGV